MLGGVQARTIPGPALRFHCSACGCGDASARTFQYGERATLLHVVPLSPYTETNYVKCENCGESFVSDVSVFDLPNYTPDQIAGVLHRRISLVVLTLTICGILLFVFPIVGLAVNVIALILNWRRRGHWTRKVSWIGTVLSVPTTALAIIAIAIG